MSNNWTEENVVLATVDPTTAGTGTSTSDIIDMSTVDRAIFVLSVGTVAVGGTVDMEIQHSTATGAGWQTGTSALASITQMTAGDDNLQAIVEVDADSLISSTTYRRYVRAVVTRGTANSNVSVVGIGSRGRYQPDTDLASVDEIVVT